MNDRMTPMEAEVLEMAVPDCAEPQDHYGTAPRPKRKRSYVGLWIGIGLVVIGLCTFSVVASMFEVNLERNEEGRLVLTMGSKQELPVQQDQVGDLQIPGELSTGETLNTQNPVRGSGLSLRAASSGTILSASELYREVSGGVVCIESTTFYGTVCSTGIVISSDGYVLTAASGIGSASSFTALFADGSSLPLRLIGQDAVTGVCLMKAEAEGLTPLTFEKNPDPVVGEQIYCVGNPYGSTILNVFYAGMLSGCESAEINDESYTLIQTSVDLQNAGYGCPIFNERGHVMGISTSIGSALLPDRADPCFGISSADLERIVQRFSERQNGGCWLGFEVEPIPEEYQYFFHYPEGVWISEVSAGTPVYNVLLTNDIILSVNGTSIRTAEEFDEAVEQGASDGYVVLILSRNGQRYYAKVPVLTR